MQTRLVISLMVLTLALPAPALAKDHGEHGRGHSNWAHEEREEHGEYGERHYERERHEERLRFRSNEFNIVFGWFDEHRERPDYRDLPPGLAKKLARGGELPPGLRGRSLPPGLAKRLGPAPRGYDRIIVGNDLLLVELSRGTIVDIIHDIFR